MVEGGAHKAPLPFPEVHTYSKLRVNRGARDISSVFVAATVKVATVNKASVNNNKFTGSLKNTSKPQNSTQIPKKK